MTRPAFDLILPPQVSRIPHASRYPVWFRIGEVRVRVRVSVGVKVVFTLSQAEPTIGILQLDLVKWMGMRKMGMRAGIGQGSWFGRLEPTLSHSLSVPSGPRYCWS